MDEIILELAILQREAEKNVRLRFEREATGVLFKGIEQNPISSTQEERVPR